MDIKSYLAIIKIDSEEFLPFVPMGRSDDLMIGEQVLAIGNPFGLRHTVITGIISALNRNIIFGKNKVYSDFIPVDALINPGNSGGPLLNINVVDWYQYSYLSESRRHWFFYPH